MSHRKKLCLLPCYACAFGIGNGALLGFAPDIFRTFWGFGCAGVTVGLGVLGNLCDCCAGPKTEENPEPPGANCARRWEQSLRPERVEGLRRQTKGSKNRGKMGTKGDSRDGASGHQPTSSRCDFSL